MQKRRECTQNATKRDRTDEAFSISLHTKWIYRDSNDLFNRQFNTISGRDNTFACLSLARSLTAIRMRLVIKYMRTNFSTVFGSHCTAPHRTMCLPGSRVHTANFNQLSWSHLNDLTLKDNAKDGNRRFGRFEFYEAAVVRRTVVVLRQQKGSSSSSQRKNNRDNFTNLLFDHTACARAITLQPPLACT